MQSTILNKKISQCLTYCLTFNNSLSNNGYTQKKKISCLMSQVKHCQIYGMRYMRYYEICEIYEIYVILWDIWDIWDICDIMRYMRYMWYCRGYEIPERGLGNPQRSRVGPWNRRRPSQLPLLLYTLYLICIYI